MKKSIAFLLLTIWALDAGQALESKDYSDWYREPNSRRTWDMGIDVGLFVGKIADQIRKGTLDDQEAKKQFDNLMRDLNGFKHRRGWQLNDPLLEAIAHIGWKPMPGDYEKVVKKLIALGADVNTSGDSISSGATPLMYALELDTATAKNIINILLDYGADPNKADKDGRTPLIDAAVKNNEENVSLLIARGAHVNQADKKGMSPVMHAVERGLIKMAQLLISKGADAKSALVYAKSRRYFGPGVGDAPTNCEMIKMLEQIVAEQTPVQQQAGAEKAKEEAVQQNVQLSWWQRFWQWLEEDVERG